MAVDEIDNEAYVWDAFVPPGREGRWPWHGALTGWFALIAFLILASVTCLWAVSYFEAQLERNARADLQSSGISSDNLNFDWDYRNLSVTGQLPAGVTEDQLLAVLEDTDNRGLRDINLSIDPLNEQPPESTQYGTVDVSMTLDNGKLLLQGVVLTESQRSTLAAAAIEAIGRENVSNEITVSGLQEKTPGSDQRVESLANSIAGLNQAESADARLSASDFRFNATVADETQADDLLRRRGNAGDVGLVISGDIVTKKSVPGGVVDVRANKENGRVLLSGVVITEEQKNRLVQAAARIFDEQSVIDEIVVAEAAAEKPLADQSVAILTTAISYFGEAIEADAHLTDEQFEFNALLEYEEDTEPLRSVSENARNLGLNVAGAIKGKQVSLNKEVELLQAEIEALADEIRENVVFDSGEADLDFTAKQTLDKVVDVMNLYQRPVVEVAGHTDSSGPEDVNRTLSLFRATAVLEYLKISGIDGLRLRARGFGEDNPVASNATEVGKKQNRRVEFSARGNFGN